MRSGIGYGPVVRQISPRKNEGINYINRYGTLHLYGSVSLTLRVTVVFASESCVLYCSYENVETNVGYVEEMAVYM